MSIDAYNQNNKEEASKKQVEYYKGILIEQLPELKGAINKFMINDDATFSADLPYGVGLYTINGKIVGNGIVAQYLIVRQYEETIKDETHITRRVSDSLVIRNVDDLNIQATKIAKADEDKQDKQLISANRNMIESLYNNYEAFINECKGSSEKELTKKYGFSSIFIKQNGNNLSM